MGSAKKYAKCVMYFLSTIVINKNGAFSIKDISEENALKLVFILETLLVYLEKAKPALAECLKKIKILNEDQTPIVNLMQQYFCTNNNINKEAYSIVNKICPDVNKIGGKKRTLRRRMSKRIRNKTNRRFKNLYKGGAGDGNDGDNEDLCFICQNSLNETEPFGNPISLHDGNIPHRLHEVCATAYVAAPYGMRCFCGADVTWIPPPPPATMLQVIQNNARQVWNMLEVNGIVENEQFEERPLLDQIVRIILVAIFIIAFFLFNLNPL